MLEQLQTMLSGTIAPSHLNVGEAHVVHQNLSAYYYLHAKCALFEHHSESPDLKDWYKHAREAAGERIGQLEAQLDQFGVPRPPSMPITTELTDQFMAIDGMAMIRGMMMADVIGLQSSIHPTLTSLHKAMFDATLLFGASLMKIADRQGWSIYPPTYEVSKPPLQ